MKLNPINWEQINKVYGELEKTPSLQQTHDYNSSLNWQLARNGKYLLLLHTRPHLANITFVAYPKQNDLWSVTNLQGDVQPLSPSLEYPHSLCSLSFLHIPQSDKWLFQYGQRHYKPLTTRNKDTSKTFFRQYAGAPNHLIELALKQAAERKVTIVLPKNEKLGREFITTIIKKAEKYGVAINQE